MSAPEHGEIRKAIAPHCGYAWFPIPHLNQYQKVLALSQKQANKANLGEWAWSFTPNYPEDLNACAVFERALTLKERKRFFLELQETNGTMGCVFANGMARCIAFMKAKGISP